MEAQGWRVEKAPKGYFKIKCNCADRHMRTVHLTPSNPNYVPQSAGMASAEELLEGAVMSYFTTFEGHVLDAVGEPLPPAQIEQSLDSILGVLLERGVADATVGGTLARGMIEISMTVEAETLEEAQKVSHALLAEAIHSLGSGHRSEVEWVAGSARRSDADLVDA